VFTSDACGLIMLSPDEKGQIRALTDLVTVLIRRISETNEAWCRKLLETIRTQRDVASANRKSRDKAFDRAIAIIERALQDYNSSHKCRPSQRPHLSAPTLVKLFRIDLRRAARPI